MGVANLAEKLDPRQVKLQREARDAERGLWK